MGGDLASIYHRWAGVFGLYLCSSSRIPSLPGLPIALCYFDILDV
jgi:hypothetical protein